MTMTVEAHHDATFTRTTTPRRPRPPAEKRVPLPEERVVTRG